MPALAWVKIGSCKNFIESVFALGIIKLWFFTLRGEYNNHKKDKMPII